MNKGKFLTTKEVARLCLVSDATVKRWEEAGIIKSERTKGGHRRFRALEIARFQRTQGLGLQQNLGDESVFASVSQNLDKRNFSDYSLYDALTSGNEAAATEIIFKAFLDRKPLSIIFDEMLCPVMSKIGERWFAGDLSVSQEHLATRTIFKALYKLRHYVPVSEPVGKIAVCCALENEFHELPTHLAQIAIESEGWEVLNFGANTPLFCLTNEILKHLPQMICISATIIQDIERLSREYTIFREAISKHKISIVIGGKIFDDACLRKRFPADLYAGSFSELSAFARELAEKHILHLTER